MDHYEVVLNSSYGGFELSKIAIKLYQKLSVGTGCEDGRDLPPEFCDSEYKFRTDPILIEVVKTLGEAANGPCAELIIVSVPAIYDFVIDEYDGAEDIVLKARKEKVVELASKPDELIQYLDGCNAFARC